MRIGVDCRPLLDRPLTGVGEYTQRLLTALVAAQTGDDYVLFSNAFRPAPVPSVPEGSGLAIRQFRVPNKLLNASFALIGRPTFRRLLGPVDLLFAPNINFFPVTLGLPFVLTIHDLSFYHFRDLLSRKRRLWHSALRLRNLVRRADGILAVSQATADDLRRTYGLPEAAVFVVHSGVTETPVDDALRQAVRERYRLPDSYLLSLATIEPRKNLLALLGAFTHLVRDHGYRGGLVLAGAPGWSRGAFGRALEAHPYRDRIHLLPYVSEPEKHALYAAADALCFLSLYEGFGFPPLEAALHGTPVITGHHSSLTEVMGGGAALVDVQNPVEIARVAAALLNDRELRGRLTGQARRIAERYSWERTARETRAVFSRVVVNHAHRD